MSESDTVMKLMSALITKMESMDNQMTEMQHVMRHPDSLLKRAGFIRMKSPSVSDVWGDPLRGDRSSVIAKAGDGEEVDATEMPKSNEEWYEMDWSDIHALAETAGAPADRGDFVTTRRSVEVNE